MMNNSHSIVLSTCDDTTTLVITDTFRDNVRITYCAQGDQNHMRASKKVILFGKAIHGKQVHQWPVAVFPNADDTKSYALFLRLAYRSKDDTAIAALDPGHAKGEDGKPLYDVKWAPVEVPYAPLPEMDDADPFEMGGTPTE